MLKNLSLRLKLTTLSVLMLTLCCVGITALSNLSAGRMANVIEATALLPAQTVTPSAEPAAVPMTLLETSQAAKSQFFQTSIFYMVLVVALGGGLTYLISGRVLRPLQTLCTQMESRTAKNLSERLPVPQGRDEIADLSKAFNQMSEQLASAFAMQQRFSQSAAHELRTPLTVLKTKVDVFLKKPTHSPEEYEQLLTVIHTHTDRLSDLVKALLELTNMDALDCDEPIALLPMLAEVAEELAPLAKERGVSLTLAGEEQTVLGNRSLLFRAFCNLAENAVKYDAEGGSVTLSVGERDKKACVTVADTGIGIPPEQRELIFEPFYRVDKSRSRQMGGAGLGLSTVRAILEKHGGTISVSENPGGGSVFTILL